MIYFVLAIVMFLYLLVFQKLNIISGLINKYKIIRIIVVLLIVFLSIYTIEILSAGTSFALGSDNKSKFESEFESNKMIVKESKKFLTGFYAPIFDKDLDANKLTPDSIKILFSELLNLCPTSIPVKEKLEIASKYGYRKYPYSEFHKGIDIRAIYGEKVYSTMNGIVDEIGYEDSYSHGYGNYILLKNEIGFKTRYAHLEKMLVKKGQRVEKNQLLGTVGLTGNSTGVNLHYEVIQDGETKNPQQFIIMGMKDSLKNNNYGNFIDPNIDNKKEDKIIPKK